MLLLESKDVKLFKIRNTFYYSVYDQNGKRLLRSTGKKHLLDAKRVIAERIANNSLIISYSFRLRVELNENNFATENNDFEALNLAVDTEKKCKQMQTNANKCKQQHQDFEKNIDLIKVNYSFGELAKDFFNYDKCPMLNDKKLRGATINKNTVYTQEKYFKKNPYLPTVGEKPHF